MLFVLVGLSPLLSFFPSLLPSVNSAKKNGEMGGQGGHISLQKEEAKEN